MSLCVCDNYPPLPAKRSISKGVLEGKLPLGVLLHKTKIVLYGKREFDTTQIIHREVRVSSFFWTRTPTLTHIISPQPPLLLSQELVIPILTGTGIFSVDVGSPYRVRIPGS